eukprot:scaffold18396_cov57-Phaeocystis_antarctica.AAC.4
MASEGAAEGATAAVRAEGPTRRDDMRTCTLEYALRKCPVQVSVRVPPESTRSFCILSRAICTSCAFCAFCAFFAAHSFCTFAQYCGNFFFAHASLISCHSSRRFWASASRAARDASALAASALAASALAATAPALR